MSLTSSSCRFLVSVGLLAASACSATAAPAEESSPSRTPIDETSFAEGEFPEYVPSEDANDAVLPTRFDLIESQTDVRDQSGRGVCNIFASTALFESLYRLEGTIPNPDFSEQFLQWSVKAEQKLFPTSEGSSETGALNTLQSFGIPMESAWNYETYSWGTSENEACTGDEPAPYFCHTNGNPSIQARFARRFRLPGYIHIPKGQASRPVGSPRATGRRYVNVSGIDYETPPSAVKIMQYLVNEKRPVLLGGVFYYQAWGHGGSDLSVNHEHKARGIVGTPNEEDISMAKRKNGAHSILLLGFDETMQAPRVDAQGEFMRDEQGNLVQDTGFFLFKNSWGDDWAQENTFTRANGEEATMPGYGWISMRHIEMWMRPSGFEGGAFSSLLPVVAPLEVCDDGIDNDRDGLVDCLDFECGQATSCNGTLHLQKTDSVSIPDQGGASLKIRGRNAVAAQVTVRFVAQHPRRSQLRISVKHDGKTVVLFERFGRSENDLARIVRVPEFDGQSLAGEWELIAEDLESGETGSIEYFAVDALPCVGTCAAPKVFSVNASPNVAIPDAPTRLGSVGRSVAARLNLTETGSLRTLRVRLSTNHIKPEQLRVELVHMASGRSVTLIDRDTDGGRLEPSYSTDAFAGLAANGRYEVRVVDTRNQFSGNLQTVSLEAFVD